MKIIDKDKEINWFRKHADTIVILGVFGAAYLNLNQKISSIEKDMAVVKAVLIMKNIMPADLCKINPLEEKI